MLVLCNDRGTRSSSSFPHRLQRIEAAASAPVVISASHDRQLNCIIRVMKSLILLLFVAISVQAQSLPDAARKERQRQANLKPTTVFTGEKPKDTTPAPATDAAAAPAKPGESTTESAAAKPADASKPAPPSPAVKPPAASAKLADDAVKKYAEEVTRLKTKIVELQDRDTATQLQLNDLKNQYLAPVTDPTTRAQAQTKLDQTQTQLSAIQKELADTRRALQVLEAQGPPKP